MNVVQISLDITPYTYVLVKNLLSFGREILAVPVTSCVF